MRRHHVGDPSRAASVAYRIVRLAPALIHSRLFRRRLAAAKVARDPVNAVTLARAYAALYEGEKSARGALDFSDLIAGAEALLDERADAAWVLYKLDGGLAHILIDEAQDTPPE